MIGQIDIEKSLLNAPNDRSLFVAVASVVNSLVDVVNELQLAKDVMFNRIDMLNNAICDIRNRITTLDDPTYHEAEAAPADNSEKANCQGSVLTMVDNQVTANLPNIDLGELSFLSKENTELKDEIDRLETELERTRKALDKAKWWLHEIVENHRCTPISTAEMALEEITALEQKDK